MLDLKAKVVLIDHGCKTKEREVEEFVKLLSPKVKLVRTSTGTTATPVSPENVEKAKCVVYFVFEQILRNPMSCSNFLTNDLPVMASNARNVAIYTDTDQIDLLDEIRTFIANGGKVFKTQEGLAEHLNQMF